MFLGTYLLHYWTLCERFLSTMLIDKMLVTSRDQEEILYIYILVAGMLSVVHFILSVLK